VERKPLDAVVGPLSASVPSSPDPERSALPTVVADGRVNILIVDDEPANLKVLEAILDDPGYRLVRASSANDALLALMAEDFGLLILDIRMPDMSGFELAQLIKQRKKSASVPIIFLTAFYNEDQDVAVGYGTGAVDYLHKPVNAAVLRSKVAVFVELHRKSRELAMANRALLLEVTERRRAEEQLRELNESLDRRVTERSEALRESEQRFRTMADQTPVMMWVTNPTGVVDFVNKEYCSFFGASHEEALHSSWRMPLHDDDSGYLRALFEALRTRRPFQADARMRRSDGEWRWMTSHGAPRTAASGEFLGMIVTSQDVSDQRHAATIQQQIARLPGFEVIQWLERCGHHVLQLRPLVGDQLGNRHEAVRIGTDILEPRQARHPVGREQAQRVPALRTPPLRHCSTLEDDVFDAQPGQRAAHGEPRLSGSDDHGGRALHGPTLW